MKDMEFIKELYTQYERINRMVEEKGCFIDEITKKTYYTGYAYKTLYDWDQYFEAIVQLYLGHSTDLIRNGVLIFLDNQDDEGFIHRSVPKTDTPQATEHVKPFLAQIVLLVYKFDKDISWITDEYYERLKKYIQYWMKQKDRNGNHLSTWDSAPHTGMDNQHERAGYWNDSFCEGVDLNCYLVRECEAMSVLASLYQKSQDEKYFTNCAQEIKKAVQTLWNEEDGIFYDRNEKTGDPIKVKYVGAFATLWSGIATREQADIMMKRYIMNSKEFWRNFPLSAYAASEAGYQEDYYPGDLGCNWRAYTWIPSNYYVFQGMRMYGYLDEAAKLAEITYQRVTEIGDREYYTSDTCKGAGLDPFWGWSLLAYFMPMEVLLEYDPTKLTISSEDIIKRTVL